MKKLTKHQIVLRKEFLLEQLKLLLEEHNDKEIVILVTHKGFGCVEYGFDETINRGYSQGVCE